MSDEIDPRDALEPRSVLDSTADEGEADDDDPDDEEEEEQDESVQAPWPTLYLDGEAQTDSDGDELERVQVEFDDVANGMLDEKQLRGPLAWCNSATIHLDRDDDAVHVLISCGDPRGAFAMTIRRVEGGLLMHVPYPADSMLHEPLTEHHPGTYKVGYWAPEPTETDAERILREDR